MVTTQPIKDQIEKDWFLVDAENKILGRLASKIASILKGKTKPIFTPYLDTGDFVVVINAQKVKLTGRKLNDKVYYHYSGYPGGMKSITPKDLLQKKPEDVIRKAVWGMLPKNSLGRQMLTKLKVYPGKEHPHQAQQPKTIEL
ncbi:MAG: 50S ribosomal protein L13 [Thermodesulfobacteriota bacterium]|jgi:large subunit ribosomal protein L13|nr:MAG: 50S ribosomal protein L13 [Thermodesulfobacteriota bacterium]